MSLPAAKEMSMDAAVLFQGIFALKEKQRTAGMAFLALLQTVWQVKLNTVAHRPTVAPPRSNGNPRAVANWLNWH